MYQFAIVALLALATVKVVDFLCDIVEPIERFRSLLTFVIAVGVTVWLDFSLFDGWGVDVRDDTLGVWVTGFVVAGLTVPWRAAFGWLTHDRATGDESLGNHTRMLRKAA
ncbi:MAG TPA: hypothetical protein VF015_10110 [Acidimicrobiales bacterium]